jgi:hypothetical protein
MARFAASAISFPAGDSCPATPNAHEPDTHKSENEIKIAGKVALPLFIRSLLPGFVVITYPSPRFY